jgi:hypothetical protein
VAQALKASPVTTTFWTVTKSWCPWFTLMRKSWATASLSLDQFVTWSVPSVSSTSKKAAPHKRLKDHSKKHLTLLLECVKHGVLHSAAICNLNKPAFDFLTTQKQCPTLQDKSENLL